MDSLSANMPWMQAWVRSAWVMLLYSFQRSDAKLSGAIAAYSSSSLPVRPPPISDRSKTALLRVCSSCGWHSSRYPSSVSSSIRAAWSQNGSLIISRGTRQAATRRMSCSR